MKGFGHKAFIIISALVCMGLFINYRRSMDVDKVILTIREPSDCIYVLYYDNGTESIFDYDHSEELNVDGSKEIQNITFEIPKGSGDKLRIDFGTGLNDREIELFAIKIYRAFKSVTIPGNEIKNKFEISKDLIFNAEKKCLEMQVTGEQPLIGSIAQEDDWKAQLEVFSLLQLALTGILGSLGGLILLYFFQILKITFKKFVLNYKDNRRLYSGISGTIIVTGILLMNLLGDFAGISWGENGRNENRVLAEKPKWSGGGQYGNLEEYITDYENFYQDNFSMRGTFVKLYTKYKNKIWKDSPTAKAVIGKNNWLYYSDTLDDYKSKEYFSERQLVRFRDWIESCAKLCRERGIEFYLVICPNKNEIYPEFMPDSIKQVNSYTRFDHMIEWLKDNSPDFHVINLKQTLVENKKNGYLYYPGDTHWNTLGAYYASAEIFDSMKATEKYIVSRDITQYVRKSIVSLGDIRAMMGDTGESNVEITEVYVPEGILEREILETNGGEDFIIRNNVNKNGKKLLIYGDSFRMGLADFLAEQYEESYFAGTHNLNAELLEQQKPNAVIFEMVERTASFYMTH